MNHILKIKDCFFQDVIHGRKKFEVRKNDRNFQVSDTFQLQNIETGIITAKKEIRYVFPGGSFGLDEKYCIFNK